MMIKRTLKILLFVLFLLISYLYLSTLVFDMDEGIALYNAWQFWNGNMAIYSSKFMEYVSPGASLSIFYLWRLVGRSDYLVAYALFLIFWILGLIGLFMISKKYKLSHTVSYLLFIYWIVIFGFTSRINHNTFSLCVGILLMHRLLTLRGWKSYLLGGIVNGVMVWYLQSTGVIFLLSACLFFIFVKRKYQNIMVYLLGFSASAIGLLSITGLKRTTIAIFGSPLYLGYLKANLSRIDTVFVMAAILIILVMMWGYRITRRQDLLLLIVLQIFMYVGSLYNFGRGHFVIISLPAIVFLAIASSEEIIKKKYPILKMIVSMLTISMAIYVVTVSLGNINKPKFSDFDYFNKFRSPFVSQANNIYAGPYLPAVYYYSGKTTSYSISHIDIAKKEALATVLQEIKAIRPELAFLNYAILPRLNYKQDNIVDNYIRKNYALCNTTIMGAQVFSLSPKYCPQ